MVRLTTRAVSVPSRCLSPAPALFRSRTSCTAICCSSRASRRKSAADSRSSSSATFTIRGASAPRTSIATASSTSFRVRTSSTDRITQTAGRFTCSRRSIHLPSTRTRCGCSSPSDFTGDGWPDALNCGQGPGCVLYVNPGKESRRWDKFPVTTGQSTEIAVMTDVDGDGRRISSSAADGIMQWATPDPANPTGAVEQHASRSTGRRSRTAWAPATSTATAAWTS